MAKAKTTRKSEETTDNNQPKASIPAPRGGDAKSMLMNFAQKGKKTTAAKKPERPEMPLSPEDQNILKDWAAGKILFDHFEDHLKNIVAALDSRLLPRYCRTMYDSKAQPVNPAIKATNDKGQPDIEAKFIVQERFSIAAPDTSDGSDPVEAMVTVLVGIGLGEDNARRLVETELDFMPQVDIHLTELLYGRKEGKQWQEPSEVEKRAAMKVMQFIDSLPDDEREVLTVTKFNKVQVKSGGFLERVASYCTSYDQLYKLLTMVIKPVVSHSGAKFGVSDALDERNSRLIQEAAKILGVKLGIEE